MYFDTLKKSSESMRNIVIYELFDIKGIQLKLRYKIKIYVFYELF